MSCHVEIDNYSNSVRTTILALSDLLTPASDDMRVATFRFTPPVQSLPAMSFFFFLSFYPPFVVIGLILIILSCYFIYCACSYLPVLR